MVISQSIDLSSLKIERRPHYPVSVKFRNAAGRWEVLFTCSTIQEAAEILASKEAHETDNG